MNVLVQADALGELREVGLPRVCKPASAVATEQQMARSSVMMGSKIPRMRIITALRTATKTDVLTIARARSVVMARIKSKFVPRELTRKKADHARLTNNAEPVEFAKILKIVI